MNEVPDRGARLIDVARAAKVSRATAARALGGYGAIGSETRQRVIETARSLGYRANEVARAMRSGKTLTIGVAVADTANSFFSNVLHAIIETASGFGYRILIANTGDEIAREIDAVRVFVEKRVDGLIVVPSSPSRFEHLLVNGEPLMPLVLLDRRIPELALASATTDDYAGARSAIRTFVAHGHQRIGLLVSTIAVQGHSARRPADAVSTVHDRVDGALEAVREAGFKLDDSWIRYSQPDLENATAASRFILSADLRPTALLATNEEMALGILATCGELNLVVGQDLSLISFDDSPWTQVFSPPISVVRRPVHELGTVVVTMLIEQMQGTSSKAVILPTELISRGSVVDLGARERAHNGSRVRPRSVRYPRVAESDAK